MIKFRLKAPLSSPFPIYLEKDKFGVMPSKVLTHKGKVWSSIFSYAIV